MENYTYSSYPDSGDSSPRSREIDVENASWDEPQNYRVKFMCSYGGKITPRPHDNQLSYVGGDTKILTVDRNIRFSTFIAKLSSLIDTATATATATDISFKYQLPGEDLDALISVTNDEDLEHMMLEYDRLLRASAKPARLRLFLFPVTAAPPISAAAKPDRQWFVDALNSAPIDSSASPPVTSNPDFLFGLEKSAVAAAVAGKNQEPPIQELTVPDPPPPARSDAGDSALLVADIQRQIFDLQRLQIATQQEQQQQQQQLQQQQQQQHQARVYQPEFYAPRPPPPEKNPQPPIPAASMPHPMQIPTSYWTERQITPPAPAAAQQMPPPAATAGDPGVYLVPTPVYRPPVAGQGYYVQRMMQDVYREPAPAPAPMYGMGAGQKMAAYGEAVVRPEAAAAAGGGAYAGMAYDSTGRQVFYTAPGGVMPTYQTVTASSVDVRQVAGAPAVLSQEPKVVTKPPPQSS